MAWAAVVGAVGTIAGGLLSRKGGGDQQRSAANAAGSRLADNSGSLWDFYQDSYKPLEMSLISDAQTAGSAAEYERAAGQAEADVSGAFGRAREANARDLASYGLSPGDGRFQAQLAGLDLSKAAVGAGAQNRARQAVKDMAWRKKMGVAALGAGLRRDSMAGLASAAGVNQSLARDADARSGAAADGLGGIIGSFTGPLGDWLSKPGSEDPTILPTGPMPPVLGFE